MLNTIYKITDTLNNKVYIGKTEFTIEKRWKEHCRDSVKERNEIRPLYDAMNKYGIENFIIEEIETNIPDELINEKEQFYINQYRSYIGFEDCNGYNATLGGDGKKYKDYNIQDIISDYQSGKSILQIGKDFNLDHTTISQLLRANNINPSQHYNISTRKKVYMYDKDTNELLQSFESISEAKKFLKLNRTNGHLNDVLNGKFKTKIAYGYRWSNIKE